MLHQTWYEENSTGRQMEEVSNNAHTISLPLVASIKKSTQTVSESHKQIFTFRVLADESFYKACSKSTLLHVPFTKLTFSGN